MRSSIEGLRVLIIEDESMVSMLIEDFLIDMGCAVVGTASRLHEALQRLSSLDFDAAVLDVNLAGVPSYPVADALKNAGIPFAIATGYGDAGIPDAFRDAPVLAKPFQQDQLRRALSAALNIETDITNRPMEQRQ
jgi:CheY-like chemotaxis protein